MDATLPGMIPVTTNPTPRTARPLQVTTDRDIPGSEAEEMSPLFKTRVQPDAITV
jgi:hypothetical protein